MPVNHNSCVRYPMWIYTVCVRVCVQKEAPPLRRPRPSCEVKLMEKIPERAEATVVLVGERRGRHG